MTVSEKAEAADADETSRQHVQEEAADEKVTCSTSNATIRWLEIAKSTNTSWLGVPILNSYSPCP
jgi:hypothetical protein